MSLDSQPYLLFLGLVCLACFKLPQRYRWAILLSASYFFYWVANPKFFYLIPTTTLISYLAALAMARAGGGRAKRGILIGSVLGCLASLLLFRYADFVVEPLNRVLGATGADFQLPVFRFFYPIGISFYTLQVVGYLIDVYRGDLEPEGNLGTYALFVSFFPSLTAGPIERAAHLIPQLKAPPGFDRERFASNALLIFGGLFKKLVIADSLALLVDPVFSDPRGQTGGVLAVALVASRYHLYCDFSGYTDIALGSAGLLGIQLTQNFNRPFAATSIADFWRRWHISLSTWIRDYVYFPLITSPFARLGLSFNIILTFAILGLWHAGSWNFLIFGLIQGCLIAVHDGTSRWRKRLGVSFGAPARILVTFLVFVCLPMAFFKTRTVSDAILVYNGLFGGVFADFSRWSDFGFVMTALGRKIYLLVALIAGLEYLQWRKRNEPIRVWIRRQPIWFRVLAYGLLVVLLLQSGMEFRQTDFVYRKF